MLKTLLRASSPFHQEIIHVAIIFFFGDFCSIALKFKTSWSQFFPARFNQCPSLPSFATDDGKQFHCLNEVLNDKTGPLLLEFSWCEKSFRILKKMASNMT